MITNRKAFGPTKALMNTLTEIAVQQGSSMRPSPGEIRLEILLGTSNSYVFQVNQTNTTVPQIPTENRLRQNDAFLPIMWSLTIKKAADIDPTSQSQAILRTFPNQYIFTGAEAVALEALYNAQIIMKTNSTDVVDYQPTSPFRRVGIAQQGLNVSAPDAAPPVINTQAFYSRDEWTGPDYGFCEYHQDLCLNGGSTNTITVQLPQGAAPDMTGTGETFNYAVLRLRGVLGQNMGDFINDASLSNFYKTNPNNS